MNNNIIHIILALVIFPIYSNATKVSKEDALQKALVFLSSKDQSATIKSFSISGNAEMYLVTTDRGWCLMSSETGVKPVLAYSQTNEFPTIEDMPPAMKWLFSDYEYAIAYARENIHMNAWNEDSEQKNTRETVCLSRLGEVKWGQSANNIGINSGCNRIYNKFCPDFYSVSCERTIVGCGAVALGQVLWYYQWPHWGLIPDEMLNDSGLVSSTQSYRIYDWDMMPSKIDMLTTIEEADNIALFLRDCGFAEHMIYGNGSSGTYMYDIRDALIDNFNYTTAEIVIRDNYPSAWVYMMKNEIREGRPVIYSGRNYEVPNSGHFFVLYGFNGDYFNINWGWRGQCNEIMCTLDHIYYQENPPAHFNDMQWAIISITPMYPSCLPSYIPDISTWGSNFVIEHVGPITLGNGTITNDKQGVILSDESVTLTSGFKIEAGAHVYIDIKDMHCDDRINDPDANEDTPDIFHAPQNLTANTNNPPAATKILRDGHILIIRDNKTFTLTGQPVE